MTSQDKINQKVWVYVRHYISVRDSVLRSGWGIIRSPVSQSMDDHISTKLSSYKFPVSRFNKH